MAQRVTGTRSDREPEPDQESGWVDDEMEVEAQGWVPVASDRLRDGSEAVLYERALGGRSAIGTQRATEAESPDRPADVSWAMMIALAICALITTFAVFAGTT